MPLIERLSSTRHTPLGMSGSISANRGRCLSSGLQSAAISRLATTLKA
jgi:hypothetical protein